MNYEIGNKKFFSFIFNAHQFTKQYTAINN